MLCVAVSAVPSGAGVDSRAAGVAPGGGGRMIERIESATFMSRGHRYSFRRVERVVPTKPMRTAAIPVGGHVRPALCPECFSVFVVPADPAVGR